MWFSTGATQALIPDPNYQYYVKDLNKVSVCGSLLERHRPSSPTQTTNTMSRISIRSVYVVLYWSDTGPHTRPKLPVLCKGSQ